MNEEFRNVVATSQDDAELSGHCTIPSCSLTELQMNFEFRPASNYDGSFGFDWMRSKERGDPMDYGELLTKGVYEYLKDRYGRLFIGLPWSNVECFISWMTISPGSRVKLKLNQYVVKETTTESHVDIHIGSVEQTGEEIRLIDDYFEITPNKISSSEFKKTRGNKPKNNKTITIKCIKPFNSTQQIKVFHKKVIEGSSNPELITLGQLNVLRNDHVKKLDKAVFIEVKTNIGNGRRTGSSLNEEDLLNKYLKQFHCEIKVDTFQNKDGTNYLNLSNDNAFKDLFVISATRRNGLRNQVSESDVLLRTADLTTPEDQSTYTDQSFGPTQPWSKLYLSTYLNYVIRDYSNYKDHLKIFLLNEVIVRFDDKKNEYVIVGGYKAGAYYGHKDNNIVMSNQRGKQDITHEVLHAKGLRHTFLDSPATDNEEFLFKKYKTFNIMDYEDSISSGKRFYSWKSQWGIVNPKLKDTNQNSDPSYPIV